MFSGINAANSAPSCSNNHKAYRAALLLFVLVSLSYSNSLDAIWTLDDNPNILQNSRLHIEDLHPETLYKTFFSPQHLDPDGSHRLNRPVAHLSFALNWYFGKDSPAGYRLVNIFTHFLTAFVLFLVIRDLLDTPNMRGKNPGREGSIALIGAALWAVNPIQTQAVVYIVQRMASLACLFYLLAIWCYIRARVSEDRRRLLYYILGLASFIAGAGSKENALLLPAALVLIEYTFFQDMGQSKVRRRLRHILAFGLCMLLMGGAWLAAHWELSSLLGYESRLFSPGQRLMTEPRIVLYYLSQIFYPVPNRLSIVHDVVLSSSPVDPLTTLPAILVVIALIGLSFLQMRKRPFLSFAILFFFLNHVVESSIIGLELIFEHRNYLPSLFLFVPAAIGFQWVLDHYRARKSNFQYVVFVFVILLVSGLGAGTYVRNMAWSDAKTFWEDAAQKAPLSIRPVANLAYEYYERQGDYRKAFELYHKALELRDYNAKTISLLHVNIACLYNFAGAFFQATEHVEKALALSPDFEQAQHLQSILLYRVGDLQRAYSVISLLVSRRPDSFEYNYTLAQVSLKMGRWAEALSRLRHCTKLSSNSAKAFTMVGIAMNLNGDHQRAQWFLRRAIGLDPKDKRALLWMIDCKLKTVEEAGAVEYTSKFIDGMSVEQIESWINLSLDEGFMSQDSKEHLSHWIWSQVRAQQFGMLKSSRS
jgi:tetratricopeptide (TPR) repeat protein